jgi:hypothetical protein
VHVQLLQAVYSQDNASYYDLLLQRIPALAFHSVNCRTLGAA